MQRRKTKRRKEMDNDEGDFEERPEKREAWRTRGLGRGDSKCECKVQRGRNELALLRNLRRKPAGGAE